MTYKIDPYVKEFIEKTIDLIDDDKFHDLYDLWCQDMNRPFGLTFHEVYELLVASNIDILITMKSIPDQFFSGYSTRELKIPSNITSLGDSAFANTTIDRLVIPSSVKEVGPYLFSNANIKKIEWRGSPKIDLDAFRGQELKQIDFTVEKGSSVELMLIEEDPTIQLHYF